MTQDHREQDSGHEQVSDNEAIRYWIAGMAALAHATLGAQEAELLRQSHWQRGRTYQEGNKVTCSTLLMSGTDGRISMQLAQQSPIATVAAERRRVELSLHFVAAGGKVAVDSAADNWVALDNFDFALTSIGLAHDEAGWHFSADHPYVLPTAEDVQTINDFVAYAVDIAQTEQ